MRKFFTYNDRIIPVHHPRVLVETAVAQGADRQALFEGTGISAEMLENPETRISYLQFALFCRNALTLTGNRTLGLDVGSNITFPQMGMLGMLIMSSTTVGEALHAAFRYNRIIAPGWDFGLRIEGELAYLSFRPTFPLAPFHILASEIVITAFNRQAQDLVGGPIPVRELRFDFPRPEHADEYRRFHDVPMLFDQPLTELIFDAALLFRKVASGDPATAKLAEQLCVQLSIPQTPTDGLVDQVRRLLSTSRGKPPDLEELSRVLQTSTRSLRRSLQEMGSSYLELLDESRRVRAEEWVRTTPMTFEQIAERLGFSNIRSFRRAFKRWMGVTPGSYREARMTSGTCVETGHAHVPFVDSDPDAADGLESTPFNSEPDAASVPESEPPDSHEEPPRQAAHDGIDRLLSS